MGFYNANHIYTYPIKKKKKKTFRDLKKKITLCIKLTHLLPFLGICGIDQMIFTWQALKRKKHASYVFLKSPCGAPKGFLSQRKRHVDLKLFCVLPHRELNLAVSTK